MNADNNDKTNITTSAVDSLIPELMTMLEAGVHFGHERSKRNPKMEKYIFMHRNRVAIFDLEQTMAELKKAALFAYNTARVPSHEILFVGTKRQARAIIKKYAEEIKQPYVTTRWLGGTLTNFRTIQKSIEKLDELKKQATSTTARLTKKEKAVRNKEIERLEHVLEGIKAMRRLPTALFVAGLHDDQIAVREAMRMNIPIIGIADTNANPDTATHAIPANDDAIRSLDLIIGTLAKAVAAGQKNPVATAAPSQLSA